MLFGFMRLLHRFCRTLCRTLVSVYWFCLACVSDLFCVWISFSFIRRWPPFDVSTFEFISSLYFNLSSRQREGVTDAEMPTEGASLLGRARGRLGRVVLFLSSHLCAAHQGSAYFTRLQTQPLCPQDGAPSGPVWARVSGCKGCVCISVCVCVRERKRADRRLGFVSLL